MEMDLNAVINKIKHEGVEKAEEEANVIMEKARKDAIGIVEKADKEKEMIIKAANLEAEKIKTSGRNALKQASRDVVVALKTEITSVFDNIIKKAVANNLEPDTLKDIITRLVTECVKKDEFGLEVLLSEKDKEALTNLLEGSLQKELKGGVTLKASPSVKNGFRFGEKGKNIYYDFTDEAITEALNIYLNKRVKEMLDEGA